MIDNENTVVAYGNEANEEKKSGMSDTARKVAIGGGIGILLGASAAAVAQTLAPKPEPINDNNDEANDEAAADTVEISGKVNDNMSFSEAFAAARAEVGPGGMFTWHGNSYSTFTADEWDGMTAAERAEYNKLIAPHVQHHDVAHHTVEVHHDAPEVVIENLVINETPETPEPEPELDLTRVRIVSGEEVELEDGNTTIIGKGFVDGHDAEFHDLSRSGQFDTAIIDVDDNGTFTDDNAFDISDQHLSLNNVEEEVAQNDDDFVYVEDSPLLPML